MRLALIQAGLRRRRAVAGPRRAGVRDGAFPCVRHCGGPVVEGADAGGPPGPRRAARAVGPDRLRLPALGGRGPSRSTGRGPPP